VCTDLKMLKVKVLNIFPAHRVFRHSGMNVSRESLSNRSGSLRKGTRSVSQLAGDFDKKSRDLDYKLGSSWEEKLEKR
jgi:hypothetical protein